MKNTYRHAAAILLAAASLVSCAAPEGAGPIKGVVIDEATGSPIAGAVVRVLREGTGGGLGGSQTICFALQTATTDAKGVYEVSGVSAKHYTDIYLDIRAFKPGYVVPKRLLPKNSIQGTTVALVRFEGSRAEWISYVLSVGNTRCGESSGRWDEGNELLWLNAIRKELVEINIKDFSGNDNASYEGIEWAYSRLTAKPGGR